jgi:hypothetical protein
MVPVNAAETTASRNSTRAIVRVERNNQRALRRMVNLKTSSAVRRVFRNVSVRTNRRHRLIRL